MVEDRIWGKIGDIKDLLKCSMENYYISFPTNTPTHTVNIYTRGHTYMHIHNSFPVFQIVY